VAIAIALDEARADCSINRSAAKSCRAKYRRLLHQRAQVHHGVRPSNGLSFATQAYPKFTVTTSAPSYTTLGDTILHASIPRLRIKSGSYSKACAARDMLNLYD
jgi:hypothetical protein